MEDSLEMPMVSDPCTRSCGGDALADGTTQCSHLADQEAFKLNSADLDVVRPPPVEVKTLLPSLPFSLSSSSSHSLSSPSSLPCSPRRPRPTRHTPGIPLPASTSPGTRGTGACRTMSTRRNGKGVISGRVSPRRERDRKTRRCIPTRSGRLREGWKRITSRNSATRWVERSLLLPFPYKPPPSFRRDYRTIWFTVRDTWLTIWTSASTSPPGSNSRSRRKPGSSASEPTTTRSGSSAHRRARLASSSGRGG